MTGPTENPIPHLGRRWAWIPKPVEEKNGGTAAAPIENLHFHAKIAAALMRAQTGLTTREIARDTRISYRTITPRMKPMCLKGIVFDTGLTRVTSDPDSRRRTRRNSAVYQLESLRDVPCHGIPRPPRKPRKATRAKREVDEDVEFWRD